MIYPISLHFDRNHGSYILCTFDEGIRLAKILFERLFSFTSNVKNVFFCSKAERPFSSDDFEFSKGQSRVRNW